MALTEGEERLLWRFLDYIRTAGMAVCVQVRTSDLTYTDDVSGGAPFYAHSQWAPLGGHARGLLEGFAAYLEQDQSGVGSRESSEEEEDGA